MKIVTLTLNPALDKSTSTDRLIPEQKLRCAALQADAGGGGINVSKGLAKLGARSTAIFPAGGHTGVQLKELIEASGIATAIIPVAGDTRENFSVTETATNLQFRFTLPGQTLSEAVVQQCLDEVAQLQPDILVGSGSLPPGVPDTFYERLAALANQIGAKLVLDTSGPALHAAADEGLYLLKPNLSELSALVGVEQLEMNQVDDAALQIIAQGKCEVVVVSLGPQGALVAHKEGFEHIPAPVVQKRSTVGAGDSMVAGMVFALSQGRSPVDMVRMGVACGSAATMNEGTRLFNPPDAFRLLAWIEQYGEKYKFRDF
jgi:6-phosphofructokinase 2